MRPTPQIPAKGERGERVSCPRVPHRIIEISKTERKRKRKKPWISSKGTPPVFELLGLDNSIIYSIVCMCRLFDIARMRMMEMSQTARQAEAYLTCYLVKESQSRKVHHFASIILSKTKKRKTKLCPSDQQIWQKRWHLGWLSDDMQTDDQTTGHYSYIRIYRIWGPLRDSWIFLKKYVIIIYRNKLKLKLRFLWNTVIKK